MVHVSRYRKMVNAARQRQCLHRVAGWKARPKAGQRSAQSIRRTIRFHQTVCSIHETSARELPHKHRHSIPVLRRAGRPGLASFARKSTARAERRQTVILTIRSKASQGPGEVLQQSDEPRAYFPHLPMKSTLLGAHYDWLDCSHGLDTLHHRACAGGTG